MWNRLRSLWMTLCVGAVAFALEGCGPWTEVEVLESGMVEHTLVMYLNANNNLAAHIVNNAYDAEKGMMGAMPSTRLVIYLDRSNSTTLYEVSYLQYGSANYVKHARVLKEYPEQTSTTPEVMNAVFEDIKRLVPSKSYGLVHAGHGSGWFPEPNSGTAYNNQKNKPLGPTNAPSASLTVGDEYDFGFLTAEEPLTRAMGYDGSTNNFTSTDEFVEGISPIKFDYIIFDACFMASVEFLYELRGVTDYVIASPVEVMGPGFPYEEVVPLLMAPKHSLRAVCEKIMEVYRTDRSFSGTESAAVSLIDCSKLEALTESVSAVWRKVATQKPASESEVVGVIAANVDEKKVQVLDRMKPAGFYDLKDLVEQLAGEGSGAEVEAFRTALNEAVVFADNTDEITSLGYSDDGISYGYAAITPKEGAESVRLCGLNCYLPRATAPVTMGWYFQTEWARRAYGL